MATMSISRHYKVRINSNGMEWHKIIFFVKICHTVNKILDANCKCTVMYNAFHNNLIFCSMLNMLFVLRVGVRNFKSV
jgi:hypothetical protein